MCGVKVALNLSNAVSSSSRNGVPGERFEQRAAEIQRAQLGQRQARGQSLECLAVDHPARPAIVVRTIVVERKAGFFERLKIAADRPRRDVALRGQFVDRHAAVARAFDLAKDRPLADHFSISRHWGIVRVQVGRLTDGSVRLKPIAMIALRSVRAASPLVTSLFLFVAALVGGALNAVAGGGSFIGVPALLSAGIAPVAANATTTLAMWPGSLSSAVAYRREIVRARHWLVTLGVASLVGGLMGGWLLIRTPDQRFLRCCRG